MNTQLPIDGVVPLTHWGLIRARGADAAKFLQGQLTNDVAGMGSSDVLLAGFCSAKGRLQASFVVWKSATDEFLMACSASVLPATLKRLSMFVLRAQCKLTDASAELTVRGVVGESARTLMTDLPVWNRREVQSGALIRLPDVRGVARCVWVAEPSIEFSVVAPVTSLDAWRLLEVQSGIPMIEAATVEQFVPQMLNYEIVGGVDFQKGCYPGQEVVARSQYRGTIKRRMFYFESDAAPAPGQEVFHSDDPAQPAGMVVNSAPLLFERHGSAALIEVKLAALQSGSLRLGSAEGAILRPGTLPYAIGSDTAQSA